MITLKQAIGLATKAHKGQWRKSEPLDKESLDLFIKLSENTLFPFILSNGNKVFCLENSLVMQKPYITHPLAVMNMMDTVEERIAAVLHDVFEDNKEYTLNHNRPIKEEKVLHWIEKDNEKYYIPTRVYDALLILTKYSKVSYIAYIESITLLNISTKVKIADIVHNLSCSPSDHAKQKYLKAIPVLLKSL